MSTCWLLSILQVEFERSALLIAHVLLGALLRLECLGTSPYLDVSNVCSAECALSLQANSAGAPHPHTRRDSIQRCRSS